MATPNRRAYRVIATALFGLAATGCAGNGGGSRLAFNPWRGGLKESLSRLEHRNDELQRELADAKDESRRLADDLELAEARSLDLASRLDKYRSVAQGGSSPLGDPDSGSRRTTRQAGQSPYMPPVTQIPNRIEVPDPPMGSGVEGTESRRSVGGEPGVEYYNFGSSGRSARSSSVGRSSGGDSQWAPIGSGSPRK
jgi:hypothetical protein